MKNKFLRKILSAVTVVGITVGILGIAAHVEAANIEKTRGRVNVDLENFTLVESTITDTDDFGLVPTDSTKNKYKLHYKNSFTDRNNIGCTYRSKSKFDLTDVTHIQFYAYALQDEEDNKFMIYVNPSSSKYYHRKDRDDLKDSLVDGSGGIWKQSSLCYSSYGTTPQDYQDNITARYSNEYVFVGLSHQWFLHDAQIFLDNKTVTSSTSGCINLRLKSHDITLLEPEQPKRVNADGSMTEYTAFGNLELGLATGDYKVGEKSNIYRDEKMVLQYTLAGDADAPAAKLSQFKFYSDKNKKNLLYTMNVSGSDKQCEIVFDSALIKKLENNNPGTLGAIYLEPVFETQDVTVEFSTNVPEAKNEVEVVKNSDKKYTIREKATQAEIGTFALNGARKIGDTFTIKYKPNSNYTGNYEFSYYNYRVCESSNQVSGSTNNWASYNSSAKYDIEETLNDTYFWLNAHVGLRTNVTLSDKEVTFNNKEVSIDEAVVEVVRGILPTGEITYTYYTDSACRNEMEELPINAGTYYVVATMAQDENYRAATSNVAILTIHKATPKLSMLKGSAITYGETLSKSIPSGRAEGVVKGTAIEGTFKWIGTPSSVVPQKAGTMQAEVEFIPTGLYAANYKNAAGTAKVTVNKADPTVSLENKTEVFDGRAVEMTGASIKGIYNEATGQKVSYDYYSDESCSNKLTGAPSDAGIYYVLAKASSNTNYNYKKMDTPAMLTIKPRESQLVQVPLGQVTGGNKYRVYVTNTAHVGPKGTIDLSLTAEGYQGAAAQDLVIQQDDAGRYYTEFIYGNISDAIGAATEFKVRADYSQDDDNNYNVSSNELTMNRNDAGKVAIIQEVELDYGGNSETRDITDIEAIFGKEVSITWLNLEALNDGDVAEFTISPDKKTLTIEPKNAGNAVAFASVSTLDKKDSWYVSYNVTVKPADIELRLTQSEVYSAQPMWADQAKAVYKNGHNSEVDITEELVITYEYYKDSEMQEEITDPVDAQIYYVKLTTPAQRNYNAGINGDGSATFTIMPAELTTTIKDKTVVYDGKAHGIEEAVVTGLLGEDTMNENIRYLYKKNDDTSEASEQVPVNAGTYTVTATYIPGEKDNYNYKDEESISAATLIIEQAECTVEYTTDKKVYNAQPVVVNTDKLILTGIEDKVLKGDERKAAVDATTYYYRSLMEAEYTAQAPVNAGVYAVYAQKAAMGNYKSAISKPSLLVIEKAEVNINIPAAELVYTGNPVEVNATVSGLYGSDIPDIECLFFEDEKEHVLMENTPVDVGTYYVRPIALEQDNYKKAIGEKEKIVITKATPVLSNMQATELVYGDELGKSKITGIATGVKGEEVTGIFEFSEAITHEVRPGGEYVVDVTFIPTGEFERNYTEAYTNVVIKVNALEPTIKGSDKEITYNGQRASIEPVSVTGPEGLVAPEGTITYEYYADEALTTLVGTEGVKNTGTYYCKVTFTSSNLSYTDISEVYRIEVKKADAAIEMYLDFEKTDSDTVDLTLRGALVGVFDDPTGTINIYKRVNGENNPYELTEAKNVLLQEKSGVFIFEAVINVKTEEIYDFKASYSVGTLDNYNIMDGELTDVDMSKNPQHIYFEESILNKEYGDDEFVLSVVDEDNGTGEIVYHIVEALNKDKAVSVASDGTVKILDTGKAFCIAKKEGDETHIATIAIVCINVSQAPIELKLEDMTTTYSGKEVSMHKPEIISNGKAVAENEKISLVYSYIHKETGMAMNSLPIEAGEYEVSVSSKECKHYYGSTKAAKALLTIKKVKSPMELKVESGDKENKQLLLKGTLPEVFDDPTGTITLYQKLSNQPESEYEVVAEEIVIHQNEDGTSYFMVLASAELNEKYDFRAVYVEGPQKNYVIEESEITDIMLKKVMSDPDTSDGQNKDDGQKQNGSKTGDRAQTMLYVTMLVVSMVTIIVTRKRIRR